VTSAPCWRDWPGGTGGRTIVVGANDYPAGMSAAPRTRTVRELILGSATGYRAFKVLTRGDQTMQRMADQYVKAKPGETVLDVGCGYGDLSSCLRDVNYIGIDSNESYIAYAKPHHDGRSEFVVGDVTEMSAGDFGTIDCAVAIGVLHHLSDAQCADMLRAVSSMLSPGGRFVAAEPAWHPEQRTTARVLAAIDRGGNVREEARYVDLLSPWFESIVTEVRHDLFWFPYTHCMITATLPSTS